MPDPLYRQIAEDMHQKIESGELRPGEPLPTEIHLREHYNASRNTIRDAVKFLITRGLVETRPGQGTFVVQTIDPFVTTLGTDTSELADAGRSLEISDARVEVQWAEGVVASELQLTEGSQLVSRHHRRFIDGIPYSLQTEFYPMSMVERGATMLIMNTSIPEGVIRYLEETLGIEQASQRYAITVRPPDETELFFFGLPDDGRLAVVEIRRTDFGESGRPLWLTVTAYPADRNKFVLSTTTRGPVETLTGEGTGPSAAARELSPEKPGTATDVLDRHAQPNRVLLGALSYDFFLAHAGPDTAMAERLYDLLVTKTRVFLDTKSLLLGEDWDRAIAEAQRCSRVTVVLVSANTDAAFYQREEIAAALDLGRRGEATHRVVPVYLGLVAPDVPYGLRLKHGLTVSDKLPIQQVAAQLLDLRRKLVAGELGARGRSRWHRQRPRDST